MYILECSTGQLYTGYSKNIKNRINAHNKGTASRFTRGRLPVTLVYQEKCVSRLHAIRREYEIKKMPRSQKVKLFID